jgi:hypothetical protein
MQPVTRKTDIICTATTQIAGNTVARFEAKTDFPVGLPLSF